MSWHHLHYLLGLKRLGFDVFFFEDSEDYPSCYDPTSFQLTENYAYGVAYAHACFERLDLADKWAYFDAHTNTWVGPCAAKAADLARSADILINVSGANPIRPWLAEIPCRVLIDTDPAFTQIRNLCDPVFRRRSEAHTHFFSFGENIAGGPAEIPNDGFHWRPTRQPVVLAAWPESAPPHEGAFSTVMQWDSYQALDYGGKTFGMKSAAFADYLHLPASTKTTLELALGTAPRAELAAAGWRLVDSLEVTRTPWTFQSYVQASRGEFSIAKHGYVVTRCGWFSERSANYLAAGRPVVVQDTGFTAWLEADAGVLAFSSPAQAAERLQAVEVDYELHALAARGIVNSYFASDTVLSRLVEECWADRPAGEVS
jgi:hypothetical protein